MIVVPRDVTCDERRFPARSMNIEEDFGDISEEDSDYEDPRKWLGEPANP